MHVLVVADNRQAAAGHCQALEAAGFHADSFISSCHPELPGTASCRTRLVEGSQSFSSTYAAVVLDCHLPGYDGVSLIRQLRAQGHQTPLLLLSPIQSVDHMVECLDAGADDFITKPYELPVLQARLRALVRRQWPHLLTVLHVGSLLRLNLLTRVAQRGQHMIELTARETELLAYLMRHAGQPCRRKDILEQAWGYRCNPGTSVLDTNINRLREKIDTGFETRLIHTVHGVGYMLAG